jgi:hypothetical protein
MARFKNWAVNNSASIETIKNIVEIIALLISALWAVYLFAEVDSPALAKSIIVNGSSEIKPLDNTKCRAIFDVSIENMGKSIFEIDSIRLSYWKFPFSDYANSKFYSFEDTLAKYDKKPIFTTISNSMSGSYPPESGSLHETFNYVLDIDESSMIIFDCIAYSHGKKYIFINDQI